MIGLPANFKQFFPAYLPASHLSVSFVMTSCSLCKLTDCLVVKVADRDCGTPKGDRSYRCVLESITTQFGFVSDDMRQSAFSSSSSNSMAASLVLVCATFEVLQLPDLVNWLLDLVNWLLDLVNWLPDL